VFWEHSGTAGIMFSMNTYTTVSMSLMSLCEGEREGTADAEDAGKLEAIDKSGCNLSPAAGVNHCICSHR